MQRVKPDGGCARQGRQRDKAGEIGEIAMPPVSSGSHRVKLHGQSPKPPPPIALKRLQMIPVYWGGLRRLSPGG
jgi:hypothetical protein